MGVATTEFRVHKCKINKDLDYGLRWSEPATALSYKLRQRAMRAANEASVRSTCRMPAISFAFEWSLNLLTVFLNIWSCYFLNDVLRAAITFEPLHFPVHAKLNTQYSRNTSNSFGHFAIRKVAAQLACGFSPQHRNNPGRYPNTNRQICWLMQWVAASGWRRRWLSACFDLFQGRTEIHLISFHWLIIREKITVMALIKVRQQVNSSWSTNSRKKLWWTQARCHSALLLFQYSKQ